MTFFKFATIFMNENNVSWFMWAYVQYAQYINDNM